MRLAIEHRTRYRFAVPQARIVQLLRMTPEHTHDQTIAAWRIDVDRDARMKQHRDGFGNCTTMLYCEGPVETLELTVTGAVVTSHSDGVLHGRGEPLPPETFRRPTPLTEADAAIAAFAYDAGGNTPLDRLHRLNAALHGRFAVDRGRPDPARTAAEAIAGERATPRDLAHLFIAGAHALGLPARYVSGYALVGENEHHPTPHGWADGWVEGIGWIGFDPSEGCCPEERHVRIAVALDAAGAAPVAGSRLGEGAEALDVDLHVHREG